MRQSAAVVFTTFDVGEEFISREVAELGSHQIVKTATRSVLGTMNDFAYLAAAQRVEANSTTSSSCRFTWPRRRAVRCIEAT
jgi:hypothetical protein